MPVDKTTHRTIKQAKHSHQLTRNLDPSTEVLIGCLQRSDDSQASGAHVTFSSFLEEPVFCRRFAGRQREPKERVRNTQISGRLDRLYCHDSSPYVHRGPFRIIEDKIEAKKWIMGVQIGVLKRQSKAIR